MFSTLWIIWCPARVEADSLALPPRPTDIPAARQSAGDPLRLSSWAFSAVPTLLAWNGEVVWASITQAELASAARTRLRLRTRGSLTCILHFDPGLLVLLWGVLVCW